MHLPVARAVEAVQVYLSLLESRAAPRNVLGDPSNSTFGFSQCGLLRRPRCRHP